MLVVCVMTLTYGLGVRGVARNLIWVGISAVVYC